ncbi:hypothetical protein LUZ60_009903 [Juncus effusus]|nr:hypothetical protein LUZ60_009903 [Juncus effusus]
MGSPEPVVRLRCAVKNYEWGKLGEESRVARLAEKNSGEEVDPARPYAEFWMGTHPSGPSYVANGLGDAVLPLKDWIAKNPRVLGEKVVELWGRDLPFLFKVLSVAKALSIQAHPDKKLAEILHKNRPDLYKDENHKPEMAIAVTEFKALCGFVTAEEIKDVINNVPEISELIGYEEEYSLEKSSSSKAYLQSIFTKLMSATQESISFSIQNLKSRLSSESKMRSLTEKEQLILLLEKQYPDDVGVISAYFFNYIKLNPGEGLYIDANEPHAYLYGECIECMATSDNVVRAGLTPKYRDVPTLCSMLTYKQGFPEILKGVKVNKNILKYTPPFDEFEVDRVSMESKEVLAFNAAPGPSIFLVMAGNGSVVFGYESNEIVFNEGDVFFVGANIEISLMNEGEEELVLFRAGVNQRFFN